MARDRNLEFIKFLIWVDKQEYKKKIFIAGNHDGTIKKMGCPAETLPPNTEYLQDSGTEFEGLKIWGSPWTPTFYDWYFMKDRGAPIKKKWNLIPEKTDILITHGPPFGILDRVGRDHVGCEDLREAMFRVKPTLHIFAHIHEQGGKKVNLVSTTCVNCSIMNDRYEPVHKPVRIEL